MLGISHDSRTLLEFIKNKERVKFKNDNIPRIEMYLGGKLKKKKINRSDY